MNGCRSVRYVCRSQEWLSRLHFLSLSRGDFPLMAGISVLCIDFAFLVMISTRHERKVGFILDRASEGARRCKGTAFVMVF